MQPDRRLKAVIRSYTIIEAEIDLNTTVLPHEGIIMAVQFRGKVLAETEDGHCSLPTVVVSGMRKSYRRYHYGYNAGTILVSFTEVGAGMVFQHPLHELFDTFKAADSFFSASEVSNLTEQLSEANSHEKQAAILNNFFLDKIKVLVVDPLICFALEELRQNKGIYSIEKLAARTHLSIDTLEKRFRQTVGASPKQVCNIIRMKSLIAHAGKYGSLTELAYEFGFYDQAHFIKQFRSFTGQSPKIFFKTPYPW